MRKPPVLKAFLTATPGTKGCGSVIPDAPDAKRDFLTRIDQLEGAFRLWILARRKPVRPQWCPPDGFALKEIAASFLSHRYYAFDLRANPVKTIVQRGPNGETLLRAQWKTKEWETGAPG